MTPKHRVVVTGVGLVSPLGIGTEETWEGLVAGRSGAAPITLFDASHHTTHFACEVKGFDPLRFLEKKDVKKVDRFIQFAVAAADFARQGQRARDDARARAAGGRLHRQRHRGLRDDRARALRAAEGRPAPDQPVLHPRRDRQPGLRLGLDPQRRQGAQLGHGHRLHQRRPRRGGLVPPDPARRRGRDDRRRLRGGDHAARRRRLLRDARALARATTRRRRPRGRSTRTATAS